MQVEQNRSTDPPPPQRLCSGHGKDRSRHHGCVCGLFVAAMVAKANIEEIHSLGALFSAVLYGSLGFLFGN